ncbi:phosphoribosylanthranilate isomerase [Cohaesibacter gelatinilyticus]|uniref:N-(5'-phosphoribosyl)anthranilate isomerase n=1 Tax=Cohaesibacter gelatinilyticus TaxID=372072 RepID=A0A285PL98_9HYPH|nr:phosphoribosylanthranilate isomerase [Cohaesibacter gelatinilyticus]SNZ20641.1 phosphoribosylanthranilate isomerase [Cohaesibacter gelatinilyticus]HAT87557.1 phosphoribosylanthranilate isomerase [Hyphomicrobiales bacterium]
MYVKICGLSTPDTIETGLASGANWIGFVFFPKSPRHVNYGEAKDLVGPVRGKASIVALTVNATDEELKAIDEAINPDIWQLHGSETPERVAEIRQKFGRPVMKALAIRDEADLAPIPDYEAVCDVLLFDAKPPKDMKTELPGGNGISFDWRLIKNLQLKKPFMLSGGLNPDNVAEAIRLTRPQGVDVSSGIESSPGVKDREKIIQFIRAAKEAAST